ncbi:MAG: M20/M25/M40 family metallo-hydrolase [Candidatus Aminicenantes bacterium]|nr:M20/M25/M40 family metallo-hydrolase [Candidatus Aminicenantes bacterium]
MSLRKTASFLLVAAVATLCLTPAFAQTYKADGNKVKSHIEYLASDQLEGRQTLTPGYQKAADYVLARFKEYGLKPSGDGGTSYFQKVPIQRPVTVNLGVPALAVDGKAFYSDDSDFTVNALSTAKTAVKGAVVFVGYGLSLPAKGLDEYAGTDVKGKIVLAYKGSPDAFTMPGGRGMMGGDPQGPPPAPLGLTNDETSDAAKIKTAFDKGAAAILLYDPNPSPMGRIMVMGGPMGGPNAPAAFTRNFLAFDVTERVFRALMRKPATASNNEFTKTLNALRWDIRGKKSRSKATGAMIALKGYDQINKYSGDGLNVIGKIEGTDPALKDQYIVLGGHLDHLGTRGSVVMNGADDDASGPAVVMEVARVLTQAGFKPKRTIIFAAWCGEEMGLLGSNYFGSKPPAGIVMDKVVANFNCDMVGLGNGIGAPGALNFPEIWDKVIKRDQDPDVISVVHPGTAGPGGSDYSAFITKGIESLALMTDGGVGHPDYHDSGDDTSKIDAEILRKTAQFVLQGTINTANETTVNMLIPDRQYLYNSMMMRFTNINAALPGAAWKNSDFANKAAVLGRMYEREISRAATSQASDPRVAQIMALLDMGAPAAPGQPQPVRKDPAVGVKSPVFGGDVKFLDLTAANVGFGRVEFAGDDTAWVVNGRLTDSGKAALKAMEANGVFAQLINPGEPLLGDFLGAAEKPFLVTGLAVVPEGLKDKIIAKKVIWGVDYDPEDVPAGLVRADAAKKVLGSASNLIANLKTIEKANDLTVKRAFYFGLIKLGWKPEDIAAFVGGSLRTLSPGMAGMRMN